MDKNMFVNFNKVAKIRKEAEEKNKELYARSSAKQLVGNLEKKFKTTFIGGIDSIEKHFGDVWGQGKDRSELTPEEKKMRERWEVCRKEILDKGNNELRAAKNEISNYTIEWNRYHKQFPVIGGNRG